MNNKKIVLKVLLVVVIFVCSYAAFFVTGKLIMNSSIVEEPEKMSSTSSSVQHEEKEELSQIKKDNPGENSASENSKKPDVKEISENVSETSLTAESSSEEKIGEVSGKEVSQNGQQENSQNGQQEVSQDSKQEQSQESDNSEKVSDVSSESSKSTESTSEESAESQAVESAHDRRLVSLLEVGGYTVDTLKQRNCKQVVTVDASWNTATISFFYLNEEGVWVQDQALTTDGYVGSQGVSREAREGTYQTPFGLYGIGEAFYIDTLPETSLNMFQVTDDTYWVDDPSSKYYNQRVGITDDKDWNSAEHMIDYYTSYHFGFVIEYNTECIPGNGSAFFFHVSSTPTAGCVGLSEYMVLEYLRKLDSSCNPCILMVT